MVHFSTDYVFNGRASRPYREDDDPEPLSVYGASKLAGERQLADSGARSLVVRTSWLFGLHGRSFPRTMWERARDGQAARVVHDQRGRPTYTVDLAKAVWKLIEGPQTGTVRPRDTLHVANAGEATWFEMAKQVFEAAGVPDRVSPCTTSDFPRPAKRPAFSALDTSRYERLTGCALPRWEDGLARFLAELRNA